MYHIDGMFVNRIHHNSPLETPTTYFNIASIGHLNQHPSCPTPLSNSSDTNRPPSSLSSHSEPVYQVTCPHDQHEAYVMVVEGYNDNT